MNHASRIVAEASVELRHSDWSEVDESSAAMYLPVGDVFILVRSTPEGAVTVSQGTQDGNLFHEVALASETPFSVAVAVAVALAKDALAQA